MSLETQSAVMRVGNNEAALKALALSGNMDAIAALKKLLDAKSSRDAAARQAGLQQPETPPVLEQVVGQLGQQEYAAGGRVRAFAGGGVGFSWDEDESLSPLERSARAQMAQRGQIGQGVTQRDVFLAANAGPGGPQRVRVGDDPGISGVWDSIKQLLGKATQDPNYGNEGRRGTPPAAATPYPEPVTVRSPATKAATKPRANVGIAPNMEQDTVERKSGPELRSAVPAPAAAPEAKDLTDAELQKRLDELTPLQKEREELRKKSREQLEAAYNAKVKNLTPSTYDRFMDFMAGVSAKGGSSAAQALGAGALNMHAKDKGRKTDMASVKEMYDKSDMLLQEAALADKERNFDKANALRKEAAALQDKIADQKSTDLLRGAQARHYNTQADYTESVRPVVEKIKADAQQTRANRPTGSGLGAASGVKPMTPAQRAAAEHRAYVELKKDINNMDVPESTLRAKAKAAVDEATRAPAAASPAGPSKTIKFSDIKLE